ncbi:MAG: hypothetical protein GTO54_02060 [Nitrososphaeria archaeon]|nr:hypothetical protein [Nitrososphaeria archaeon]
MGRRRRKRIVKSIRKTIPTVFNCPNCGAQAVIVNMNRKNSSAMVTCGYCKLKWNTQIKSFEERVDVYSQFVDAFLEGEVVYEGKD